MMSYREAVAVTNRLIRDNGEGYDWCCCNNRKLSISQEAKHLALDVIPEHSLRHYALEKAVRKAIGQKNMIRYHWLVKSLALCLDDDMFGDHITIGKLNAAAFYRTVLAI